ncbi:MAG TPA: lytic transglycosylase domain-containing protein [Thermoanaerobaculia bacterium]|nr:lytic transglycosylase domain-containing protein [Thermoanaerobaculia bacterium]
MSDSGVRRESAVRHVLIGGLAALTAGLLAMMVWEGGRARRLGPEPAAEPAAPLELARYAERFRDGLAALGAGHGERAVELLSSFTFEGRPVEQYRLVHLANAYQLAGEPARARHALAVLWDMHPSLVAYPDIAVDLGTLYAEAGSSRRAAEVFGALATRAGDPAVAAAARDQYLRARFRLGDLSAVLLAAQNILVSHPGSDEAKTAESILRSLRGLGPDAEIPLTISQRIRRAEALLELAHPKAALDEVDELDPEMIPEPLADRLRVALGEALHRTGKFETSDQTLEPLFSKSYRSAIPALELSMKNRRSMADAIQTVEYETVRVRERSGTRVVTRKGKRVRVPAYRTVTRRVERVKPKEKAERDRQEAIYLERLNDLRSLPIEIELRREVLRRLVAWALAAEDEEQLRRWVGELVEIDPADDTALQAFWDRGWAAWAAGDADGAADLFNFIAATYRNPNIRRQATYWFARSLERRGSEGAAKEIYTELASAPYDDLYALYSRRRLGGSSSPPPPATLPPEISWEEIAEQQMPDELRLAWELAVLGASRDARAEVQRNVSFENRTWADAILGDLYYVDGAYDLAYRYLRRAWPELATPEQNAVPRRFVEMYYPLRYEELIREAARKNDLDPYLLMALIRQESAFNPEARSRAGAIGLMQLMPATGRELGNRLYAGFVESRLAHPDVNIELGSHYLRRVVDMLDGNTELALAGYNGGPYRIRRWRAADPSRPLDEFLEGMPLSETRNYVKRITLLRSSYERLYGAEPPSADPQIAERPAGPPGSPSIHPN